MFRSIFASAAALAIVAGATAQNQLPAGNLHKSVTPSHGVYSLESGFQVSTQAYRSGPETLYNNRDGATYYYTTVADTDEYVDEGSFARRGVTHTEQVNGITFEYCSAMPDPLGTNDVLDTELRMYDSTVAGAGPPSWTSSSADHGATCSLGLVGLPGDGGAGFACWIVTVDLTGGYECTLPQELSAGSADTFGWSMMYLDPAGSTGPILDSLVGATSVGYGALDQFEWYDLLQAAGSEYLGSYWFGGVAKAQGSFNMSMQGNVNDTSAYYSATPGANDTVDWQATAEVRGGQAAGWAVTNPDGVHNYGMLVSKHSADIGIVGGTASLLISPSPANLLHAPIPMGVGGAFGANMPPSLPANIYTQAVQHTGALTPGNTTAASNGLHHSN
jgi:hypothetical protein